MKRYFKHIPIIILLTIVMVGLSGHVAEAQTKILSMFGLDLGNWVTQMAAWFVNINLWIASWILAIAGFCLNFSVNMTLNIKEFVDQTPAIFVVWKAIRDISGMFIIFALLYAAIRMILGFDAKMGQLIKTVVIAGILINFSFFVAGLGIDVSNVVSVQLYNAIAPANKLNDGGLGKLDAAGIQSRLKDGGISDIFMQSLKITTLYNPKVLKQNNPGDGTTNDSSIVSAPIRIILTGVVGVIIMYTAALSFFLASIAFVVRFVILLFLLAFSPIWFASFAIPQLKTYSTKWVDTYKGQLMFMPVYLLLMYFAMSVLTSNTIFGSGYQTVGKDTGEWYASFLLLGVNAAMVIIMLNLPLIAAISLGAKMPGWANKMGADNIWKKVGGGIGRFAGRNTLGAVASRANDSPFAKKFYASNPSLGLAVSKGLSKVSGAGFGDKKGSYDAVLKQKKKDLLGLQKHVGKEYQSTLNEHLAKPSILTGMISRRAGKQIIDDEQKKAAKKAKVKQKKSLQEAKQAAETETRTLEKGTPAVGYAPAKPPTAEDIEKIKKLKDRVAEYEKDLSEIEEIEEDMSSDLLADKISKKSKEKDDSGNKDKEKDKDKDKSKTS